MRRAHVREKILQVGARLEHQRPSQLAVERVLDDYVENPHTVIEKNLQLLFGSLGRVLAGEDRSMALVRFSRQAVASRRRQDFFASCPQDRHVLHQALTAYAEMLRDLAAGDRAAAFSKPSDDLVPAARCILRARPGPLSG